MGRKHTRTHAHTSTAFTAIPAAEIRRASKRRTALLQATNFSPACIATNTRKTHIYQAHTVRRSILEHPSACTPSTLNPYPPCPPPSLPGFHTPVPRKPVQQATNQHDGAQVSAREPSRRKPQDGGRPVAAIVEVGPEGGWRGGDKGGAAQGGCERRGEHGRQRRRRRRGRGEEGGSCGSAAAPLRPACGGDAVREGGGGARG